MNWFQIAFVCCVSLLLVLGTGIPPSSSTLTTSKTYPSGYDPHGGYVDRLVFRLPDYLDIDEVLLGFQSGDVDAYEGVIPHQAIPELQANPAIEISSELGLSVQYFSLRCDEFPTNLTGYRRALAYALDKHTVVENARGGYAQVIDNPIPLVYSFWTYEDQMTSHYYHEDITAANASLDSINIIDTPDSPHPGWRYYDADMSGSWTPGDKRGDVYAPNGLKVELWAQAGDNPALQACVALADAMEKCGLQSEVVWVDFNACTDACPTPETGCYSFRFDPPGFPTFLYDYFHVHGSFTRWFTRFNNADYNDNCSMFINATSRLEARDWAWNCCRILLDEMPIIICYNNENTQAYCTDIWEGYVNQVGMNRMGGSPYTFEKLRLKEDAGGPFGCFPTEYVTLLVRDWYASTQLPFAQPYDRTARLIMSLIYSSLLRVDPFDPDANFAQNLASNWFTNITTASGDIQDGIRFSFHLFDNITWHDGTAFAAEDVRYSLMTIYPTSGHFGSEMVASIYRVDTPNDFTVEIYSNSSSYVKSTEFLEFLILPKHIWSLYEDEDFNWDLVTPSDFTGTGCFRWVTRTTGYWPDYIILDRYAGWHFAVEQPPRIPCPRPLPPVWLTLTLLTGILIIAAQIVVFGYLLHRRRKRETKKGEEGT